MYYTLLSLSTGEPIRQTRRVWIENPNGGSLDVIYRKEVITSFDNIRQARNFINTHFFYLCNGVVATCVSKNKTRPNMVSKHTIEIIKHEDDTQREYQDVDSV